MIFWGTVFVCPQFPYRGNDMHDILDFFYCLLSRVLHLTLAKFATIWIWVSSQWGHHRLHLVGSMDDQAISCGLLHYLLYRTNKTQQGQNSCPRLQFLPFSLDSIMSFYCCFLRNISLASLFPKKSSICKIIDRQQISCSTVLFKRITVVSPQVRFPPSRFASTKS